MLRVMLRAESKFQTIGVFDFEPHALSVLPENLGILGILGTNNSVNKLYDGTHSGFLNLNDGLAL